MHSYYHKYDGKRRYFKIKLLWLKIRIDKVFLMVVLKITMINIPNHSSYLNVPAEIRL